MGGRLPAARREGGAGLAATICNDQTYPDVRG
jgi:hypothetical protein